MPSPHVLDVTAQTFAREVLERSSQVPVLVDFWADWCNPCKMLAPVLVKLVEEAAGGLVLAKVNTEEQQELALQFGIRSLPTVKLFRDGQVVDEFMGALPEAQLRAFVGPYLERQSDRGLARAQALADGGDLEAAVEQAAAAHAEDPDNHRVTLGFVELLVAAGRRDEARHELSTLPANEQESTEAKRLAAVLRFADVAAGSAPLADLNRALAANPADSEARYAAAAHQVLQGDYEQAMQHLFEIFQRDRRFAEDGARKALVAVFELAGDHGAVADYRRKMSALMH